MSMYNGRHGADLSHYLRDLNTINPQDTTADDGFNIEDDLALFTNTQFFDFDSGQNMDFQAHPVKPEVDAANSSPAEEVTSASSVMGDIPGLEFISGQCRHFVLVVHAGFGFLCGPGPRALAELTTRHVGPIHVSLVWLWGGSGPT